METAHETLLLSTLFSNGINRINECNQTVWQSVGLFWTVQAVLLNIVFENGKIHATTEVIYLSLIGLIISFFWFLVIQRSILWLTHFEERVKQIEKKLNIEELSITGSLGPEGHGKKHEFIAGTIPLPTIRSIFIWSCFFAFMAWGLLGLGMFIALR